MAPTNYSHNKIARQITNHQKMRNETQPTQPHIGTLNEGSLHADLKLHYSQPGDIFEVPIESFVVDIFRTKNNEKSIIEIQTTAFASMRKKLNALLESYKITIVYPVSIHTTLLKPGKTPRKSPKRGDIYTLFSELVSIPNLLQHPNLSFDVVLVSVKKIQKYEKQLRRNRGGYRTINTQLVSIHDTHHFDGLQDFMKLLPDDLPDQFTTADISKLGNMPRSTAQQMAYCLRKADVFTEIGKSKLGKIYEKKST
jgi:hypothetical protein